MQGRVVDGKIVGLQTEMRQRFNTFEERFNKQDIETRQRSSEQNSKLAGLQNKMQQRFSEQNSRFERIGTALSQILERLPEKP